MRRIFTTGDGQGAEEESDAKTHLRARYKTPFKALGASRGYCLAPQIRSTWPPSPYRLEPVHSWGSVSSSPAGRVATALCRDTLSYRVIANLRTGFLCLRRDFAQIEPKSDLSLT